MARGNVMCNGNAIFLSRGNSLSKEGEEEGGDSVTGVDTPDPFIIS